MLKNIVQKVTPPVRANVGAAMNRSTDKYASAQSQKTTEDQNGLGGRWTQSFPVGGYKDIKKVIK